VIPSTFSAALIFTSTIRHGRIAFACGVPFLVVFIPIEAPRISPGTAWVSFTANKNLSTTDQMIIGAFKTYTVLLQPSGAQ
jgi:hypothetical protein